jgi:hypothetical protein
MFEARKLSDRLNPKNVMRECCDSEEHPNTVPVILALDVTGSMGPAAVETAKKLGVVMTRLYNEVKDVEFMIMGIGDFKYDRYPLQASQFESDIRISEQLDELYFEGGGGSNPYESYTAAWYFGINHTKLDCWKRGKKGIIITMGDEPINPIIPIQGHRADFGTYMGDGVQGDIETEDLAKQVFEKFDVFHVHVAHDGRSRHETDDIVNSFKRWLPAQNVISAGVEDIADTVIDIVKTAAKGCNATPTYAQNSDQVVTW